MSRPLLADPPPQTATTRARLLAAADWSWTNGPSLERQDDEMPINARGQVWPRDSRAGAR